MLKAANHKYQIISRSPWHVISRKVLDRLHLLFQPWAKRQLEHRMSLDFLELRPPDALPPNYVDLLFLYKAVRRRRPLSILEFGSGCSTVVMRQALRHNEEPIGGFLCSLESEKRWAGITRKIMPSHLVNMGQVWLSSLATHSCKGEIAFEYTFAKELSGVSPDFIYVDGPALTHGVQVGCDVLGVERWLEKGAFVVVDGRWQTILFLRKHLQRRYTFKHYGLPFRSTFELRS